MKQILLKQWNKAVNPVRQLQKSVWSSKSHFKNWQDIKEMISSVGTDNTLVNAIF